MAMLLADVGGTNARLALARDGVNSLAIEASSHGLAQYRLDGVRIRLAAFTNLTRDHLDYHGGMDAYRAAKLRLFANQGPDDACVYNRSDPALRDVELKRTDRHVERNVEREAGGDSR